jgi:ketosteroid isomerase-like protein
MKNLMIGFTMLFGLLIITSNMSAQASNSQQTTDEIINIVKAQWASEAADPSNVKEHFKNIADDYTEFNPSYSTRLEGKALCMRLSEASSKDPGAFLAGEMLNPKVQVYGDVAILSYNFAGVVRNKDGEVEQTRAKSTRVYAKQAGQWKLVHGNFASDPMPEN